MITYGNIGEAASTPERNELTQRGIFGAENAEYMNELALDTIALFANSVFGVLSDKYL